MIGKDRIVFDPANAAETDNVGAYIRAAAGTLITSTNLSSTDRLDVNTLSEKNEDDAHVSGHRGNFILGVRHDANTSMVDTDGDYAALQLDATGRLKVVADLVSNSDYIYAEDEASADGNLGAYVLSVRQDTLASSTSADGDFQSFKTDSLGALWVHTVSTAPVNANDTLANAAATVGVAAAAITASLATRRRIIIQNVDNSKSIYLGTATVTTATGLRLSPGAALEIELAAATSIYAIAGVAGVLARVLETGHT